MSTEATTTVLAMGTAAADDVEVDVGGDDRRRVPGTLGPCTARLVLEFGVWASAAFTFVWLLWLTWNEAAAFGGALTGYVALSSLSLVFCLVTPLVLPWRSAIPYRLLGGVGVLAFGADQLSKWLAVCYLKGRPSIPLVGSLLSLTYVENPGAAFGLLRGHTTLFIVMALFTVAIIFVYFRLTGPDERLVQTALILILAGALGNLMDRVFLGYVVDFFDVQYGTFRWPVFNIADTVIDVGVAFVVIDVVRDILRGSPDGQGETTAGD